MGILDFRDGSWALAPTDKATATPHNTLTFPHFLPRGDWGSHVSMRCHANAQISAKSRSLHLSHSSAMSWQIAPLPCIARCLTNDDCVVYRSNPPHGEDERVKRTSMSLTDTPWSNPTDLELSPLACATCRLSYCTGSSRHSASLPQQGRAALGGSICRVIQPLVKHAACIHIANVTLDAHHIRCQRQWLETGIDFPHARSPHCSSWPIKNSKDAPWTRIRLTAAAVAPLRTVCLANPLGSGWRAGLCCQVSFVLWRLNRASLPSPCQPASGAEQPPRKKASKWFPSRRR
jgi:hypothetical protein